MQGVVDQRARRERAHAAGVRARVAIEHALVILRRPERHRRKPSVSTKNDTSGPLRHSSSTTRAPAARNGRAAHHVADAPLQLRRGLGAPPLPCRQPGRRPSPRAASRASPSRRVERVGLRRPRRQIARSGRRWRAMNSFAQALLVSSRAAAAWGPTIGRPAPRKRRRRRPTGEARPDHGQIDVFERAQREQRRPGSARSSGRFGRDLRCRRCPARRGPVRRRRQRAAPGQGVLARAAAKNEEFTAG